MGCRLGDSHKALAGVQVRGSGRLAQWTAVGREKGEGKWRGVWAGWVIRSDLGARLEGAKDKSEIWGDPLRGALLQCLTEIIADECMKSTILGFVESVRSPPHPLCYVTLKKNAGAKGNTIVRTFARKVLFFFFF